MAKKKTTDHSQLKSDVMDLLNQVAIKLKDIGPPMTTENYNYQEVVVTQEHIDDAKSDLEEDEELPEEFEGFDETTQYLACVKKMVSRAVEGDLYSVAHNEDQYYTSNC